MDTPNPIERRPEVESLIYLIRGHKVMLSHDLARLYDVKPRVLVQAVRRNADRFPEDFMFQLSWEEAGRAIPRCSAENAKQTSRSQSVILNRGQNIKYRPYAFTEQGVAMLSSVLRSKRAIQVNIEIMRAFVRLRALLASHVELARRLDDLESRYDEQFRRVFEAIQELMAPSAPPDPPRPSIGFRPDS
jgi:hypothetical protein